MKQKLTSTKNRNLHLIAGISMAILAIILRKKKTWRNVLAGLAMIELANAAFRFATPADVEDLTETMVSELVQTAMVDGILMRWEAHGKEHGQPVVFVHGFPTHPRLWRYVIPRTALTGSYCLAWEMVGYGRSLKEGLGKDISVTKQAKYLLKWLKHMRIDKAIFVGHDLGGGVVQRLAVEHPDLVEGIVLADCVAYDNWPISTVKTARQMAGFIELLPTALLKPVFLWALFNLGHDRNSRRSESAEMHWHPYARSIGSEAFAHQLRSLDSEDTMSISDRLSKLNIPARVVWSISDPLSIESGKRLARDLDAPLLIAKNGKHFSPEDHPEIIAQAIKGILIEIEEMAI